MATKIVFTFLILVALLISAPIWAEEQSAEELAKVSQNPVANIISVPFQNNMNFNTGPGDRTQNELLIEPVIPIHINEDWNVITRTIIPVLSQPTENPSDRVNGFGPTSISAFLSPAKASSGLIWGAGPVIQVPTVSNNNLGSRNWGFGSTFAALAIEGHWLVGLLVNNIFSTGGSDPSYSTFLAQPFINYNIPGGWYFTSSPIITANWKAVGSDVWTVPLGGGIGKIWRVGKLGLPIDTQIQAFYNVATPTGGPNWTLRFQLKVLLPE